MYIKSVVSIEGEHNLRRLIHEFSDFYFEFGLYKGDKELVIHVQNPVYAKITATDDYAMKEQITSNNVLFKVEKSLMLEEFLAIGDNREYYENLAKEDDEHLEHFLIKTTLFIYEFITYEGVSITH